MMGKAGELVGGLKPVLAMVIVQVAVSSANVLYKLAANDGMNVRVIIAYRFIFATAFIAPLALIFERNKRPKLSWTIVFQSFLCALFGGTLCQNMFLESLMLTSVTFAAAMTNLAPAITFILAISFKLEKMGIKTIAGKAKVVGTIVGIGGAMLLTFYKGIEINIWHSHINLLKHNLSHHHANHNPGLGLLLAFGSCFGYAFLLIIQAKMCEKYPCPYSLTALMSLMASIQATGFAILMDKDWSQWRLGWNIRLFTAAYAGIIAAGVMYTLIIWCVHRNGPLFVSIFNPLLLVFSALGGCIFLNENLHIGSILGAILIIGGLYIVLWGKHKEKNKITQVVSQNISKENPNIQVVVLPATKD